jgi:hypothetical protein
MNSFYRRAVAAIEAFAPAQKSPRGARETLMQRAHDGVASKHREDIEADPLDVRRDA